MAAEGGVHGWLVIDKPLGVSSSQAVAVVRRRAAAKAGHAGTLDPLATGVLPIALGEATKTVGYAMAGRKRYRFCVRWGVARDSDDLEGRVVGETAARPAKTAIEAVLSQFIGIIAQAPPAHSAVRIGGRRAYRLARAGRPPVLPARPVEVGALRLIGVPDPDHALFEATVGKGVYIRALARDLAVSLGTFGHLVELRRLAVGRFTEGQAISLETVNSWRHIGDACGCLLPIETALEDVPVLPLARADAVRLRCGQRVRPPDPAVQAEIARLEGGSIVAALSDAAVVALARIDGGALRAVRVFNC